tara:strand:- start:9 stop:2447 length:2439 start_codon:yes stop_codon:yes gene_type:complete
MSGPFGSSQWMYNSGEDYAVGNSLRMNNPDSAHLARSIDTASNRRTFTISLWAKRAGLYNSMQLMGARSGSSFSLFYFSNHRFLFYSNDSNGEFQAATSALHRDTSAWMHVVLAVDTTQGTQSNRVKIYVNGVQRSLSSSNYPENFDTYINSTLEQQIGRQSTGADHYDGYLAEMHFVDGAALAPTSFGEFGIYGEWKPIDCKDDLTYGTHGFYLDFASSGVGTASSSTVGADRSGNDNHWTSTNVAATDQMLDSCTNNFSTINTNWNDAGAIELTEGNMRFTPTTNDTNCFGRCTHPVSSGKWYAEMLITENGAGQSSSLAFLKSTTIGDVGTGYGFQIQFNASNTQIKKIVAGTTTTINTSFADGSIAMLAFDLDNGKVWVGYNGTWYNNNNASTTWDASNHDGASVPAGMYVPAIQAYKDGSSAFNTSTVNFGQDSSFAGAKTAGANADGNGIGDFFYAPPSGFLALCTKNLPTPVIVPSQHFHSVTYTGNGSDSKAIAVNFQPDFTWIKNRSAADSHQIFDAIRGVTKTMHSDTTGAETTNADTLSAFTTTGFTIDDDDVVNTNNENYVAWNWKANGTGSSNTNGSINSTVSVNTDAGFSIVSYTGTGSNATVGHGLSLTPEIIIVKNRITTDEPWFVYSNADPTDFLRLNETDATADNATIWNDTAPTSSVFSIGDNTGINGSSQAHIAYCFRSVDGYSKFGSYTGNGAADGAFIYTGFRPGLVIAHRTDTADNWVIRDSVRSPDNPVNESLYSNVANVEYTGDDLLIDMTADGFKVRNTDAASNADGGTYIYLAWAETPFKYANAR